MRYRRCAVANVVIANMKLWWIVCVVAKQSTRNSGSARQQQPFILAAFTCSALCRHTLSDFVHLTSHPRVLQLLSWSKVGSHAGSVPRFAMQPTGEGGNGT